MEPSTSETISGFAGDTSLMELIIKLIKDQSVVEGFKFDVYKNIKPEIIKKYPEDIDWIVYLSCCRTITTETIQLAYNKIGEIAFFYLSANKNLTDDLKFEYQNYLCDLDY